MLHKKAIRKEEARHDTEKTNGEATRRERRKEGGKEGRKEMKGRKKRNGKRGNEETMKKGDRKVREIGK